MEIPQADFDRMMAEINDPDPQISEDLLHALQENSARYPDGFTTEPYDPDKHGPLPDDDQMLHPGDEGF